jgi:hypothetical protein
MAATITVGRAIADVIDRETVKRLTGADKRIATETTRLWDLWHSYAVLTDAERGAGAGDDQLIAFAHLLPASI